MTNVPDEAVNALAEVLLSELRGAEDGEGIYFLPGAFARALAAAAPFLADGTGVGWQPIETAPKDGTPIFVYREHTGWEYFVVKWINDRFFTLDSDYNPFSPAFGPPTHWKPLDPPPAPKAEG